MIEKNERRRRKPKQIKHPVRKNWDMVEDPSTTYNRAKLKRELKEIVETDEDDADKWIPQEDEFDE